MLLPRLLHVSPCIAIQVEKRDEVAFRAEVHRGAAQDERQRVVGNRDAELVVAPARREGPMTILFDELGREM